MRRINLIVLVVGVIIGIFVGGILAVALPANQAAHYSINFDTMDQHRKEFITMRDAMQQEMMDHGDYACCLEKPCIYCLEKSPGHGEGAACHCLEDIVNGVHPCGECIGEILEGHGNRFLSKYFAQAIADEVGENQIDALRQIIEDKYDMPVAEQM